MCNPFGGGGGGSSSGDTRIYTQSTSLPGWVDTGSQENWELAKTLSNRPWQPYPNDRMADFNADQQAAFAGTRNLQGQWQQPLNQAITAATGITGQTWPGANVQSYMSPYISNVADALTTDINRQGAIQRQDIERAASTAGAWGGGRHGVVEGEQLRGQNEALARNLAALYHSGYGQAQQQFNADRSAQLQAAGLTGNLAGAGQQYGLTDLQALLGIGGQQQQFAQAGADLGYYDFLQQREYPIEMLNLRLSSLANSPYTTSTMSQVPVTQPNLFTQGLGALTTGLGLYGMLR